MSKYNLDDGPRPIRHNAHKAKPRRKRQQEDIPEQVPPPIIYKEAIEAKEVKEAIEAIEASETEPDDDTSQSSQTSQTSDEESHHDSPSDLNTNLIEKPTNEIQRILNMDDEDIMNELNV
jgi:hypothetical protein